MTVQEFRKIALNIPGAVERSHMNHPDFRLAGKIFASVGVPDKDHGMIKFRPAQQREFIKKAPGIFKPSSGAWGGQGCTSVYLPAAKATLIRAALHVASRFGGKTRRKDGSTRAQTNDKR
jgi:hypothetical protein